MAASSLPAAEPDVNGDGSVDWFDSTALRDHLIGHAVASGTTDVNDDGEVDIADVVGLHTYLFLHYSDPSDRATPIDPTVPGGFLDDVKFLIEGPGPLQVGVEEETLEAKRAAVLRGRVLDQNGDPVAGVEITILRHPEFGMGFSRIDGMFDMVVNGGGPLVVKYTSAAYLPLQRSIEVPWQQFVFLPDVVMTPLDPIATEIDFSEEMQIAQGSVVSDGHGVRQSALLFPSNAAPTIVDEDGESPLNEMTVRITEYTVGDLGPEAMPAELPPTSGYTYCVEFSADELLGDDEATIDFEEPVINYVENWLGAEVGSAVPVGYYDRAKGAWVPSESGLVVAVVSVEGDKATLDLDGDETADGQAALDELGITDDELRRVAQLYTAGQSLWRVPVQHFSPWDCNWGIAPPEDAEFPRMREPEKKKEEKDPCEKQNASMIEVQNQILHESFPIAGTPYSLHYASSRAEGYRENHLIRIPLSGDDVPASLVAVTAEVSIAGNLYQQRFERPGGCGDRVPSLGFVSSSASLPTGERSRGESSSIVQTPAGLRAAIETEDLSNLTWEFEWDGLDAYDRPVSGIAGADVRIGYVYCAVYTNSSRFGGQGERIEASRGRDDMTLWTTYVIKVGGWRVKSQGLGGWSLDVHHTYDPIARVLYRGDGIPVDSSHLPRIMSTFVGNGDWCTIDEGDCGDGGLATDAPTCDPWGITIDPDGTVYYAESCMHKIRQVTPDGIITTIAGTGHPYYSGDWGPAVNAAINQPMGIDLGPDGTLYLTQNVSHRVRMITPDGIMLPFAGTRLPGFDGDGGDALDAQLDTPVDVAVGPDNSVYIADWWNRRIRKVDPDGIITTVAGGGTETVPPEGIRATDAKIGSPYGVDVGPDGSIYIGDYWSCIVRRVSPDGIMTNFAGNGVLGYSGDGGPATEASLNLPGFVSVGPDGTVYIVDWQNHCIRAVDQRGTITTVAGTGNQAQDYDGDNRPATDASIASPVYAKMHPDGRLLISTGGVDRVVQVSPALPGFSVNDFLIPSADGDELYQFDLSGRHLKTLETYNYATVHEFGYDGRGLLSSITDDQGTTLIERGADGEPTALVSPYGHRTELAVNEEGDLASITDPAGEKLELQYTGGGLLTELRDAADSVWIYRYDSRGNLVMASDPEGGQLRQSRTALTDGYRVEATTAENRTTTYTVTRLETGGQLRTAEFPDGSLTSTTIGADSGRLITFPDGTEVTVTYTGDPRWQTHVPVVEQIDVVTPSGKHATMRHTSTAQFDQEGNPLSLFYFTRSLVLNQRKFSARYSRNANEIYFTSPAGRNATVALDEEGGITGGTPGPGLSDVEVTPGENGLPASIQVGDRTVTATYDSLDRVDTITDALGHQAAYAYDSADRLIQTQLPGGRVYSYAYDAAGNLSQITMPNNAVHEIGYDRRGLVTSYTPPANSSRKYRFVYSPDRDLTESELPSGRSITFDYDPGGLLTGYSHSDAAVQFEYESGGSGCCSGGLARTITRTPAAGLDVQTIALEYDGFLPTRITWSGAVNAEYQYRYDDNLAVVGVTFNSDAETPITRDADGYLSGIGNFSFTRTGPAGAATRIDDGLCQINQEYNSYGELTRRRYTVNGTDIYDLELTRDTAGRITGKTETLPSSTSLSREYTFDPDGLLIQVDDGGATLEFHQYGVNGNRTVSSSGNATYDMQDRIQSLGGVSYTVDEDGFLVARGTDTFTYSASGELISADVGGQAVSFVYDGLGRRVTRNAPGGTTSYLYGDPDNPFLVTATKTADVWTRYTYDDHHRLMAMKRGGDGFYVATDHLGSPRVVVDSAGTVQKVMEYDAFGRILSDSDPSFEMPITFAGGIADEATGLIRFGLRDYDPASGRWTARDPLFFGGSQANLYMYAAGDPVNATDPSGLFDLPGRKSGKPAGELGEKLSDLMDLMEMAKDANKLNDFMEDPDESFARKRAALLQCIFKHMPWGQLPILGEWYKKASKKTLEQGLENVEKYIDRMEKFNEMLKDEIFGGDPCKKKKDKEKGRRKLPC